MGECDDYWDGDDWYDGDPHDQRVTLDGRTFDNADADALVERDQPTECVVQVGRHPGPCWINKNNGLIVCSRHKAQYEERADEFGPFDWERRRR